MRRPRGARPQRSNATLRSTSWGGASRVWIANWHRGQKIEIKILTPKSATRLDKELPGHSQHARHVCDPLPGARRRSAPRSRRPRPVHLRGFRHCSRRVTSGRRRCPFEAVFSSRTRAAEAPLGPQASRQEGTGAKPGRLNPLTIPREANNLGPFPEPKRQ